MLHLLTSALGTYLPKLLGQSMSLPGYIRPQLVLLSRARRRPRYRDSVRCSRFSCGRAGAGRPEDFPCAGRSGSPSSFSTNASRTASDRARCHQSIRRPGARTGLSMATSNIARSRVRPWIISRVLIAHTCFGPNGGLAPVSLPLFQGMRVRAVKSQLSLSVMILLLSY